MTFLHLATGIWLQAQLRNSKRSTTTEPDALACWLLNECAVVHWEHWSDCQFNWACWNSQNL